MHVIDVHGQDATIETKTFDTFDAFLQWKTSKEQERNSWFVQHRQKRVGKDNTTYNFYCNRSGSMKAVEERKRVVKMQGLSKMNAKSSACMKAVVNSSNEVHVEYNLIHIGHDSKLGHLRISDELRSSIATKLARKIPVSAILDDIRDNLSGNLSRDHLTTRQDIQNIMHQYNLNLVQKHSEDATSVNCWVRDLQDKDFDCILCYKPQGVEKYGLPDSDFLLGLQTELQKDSLVKYGTKLVCIDSKHSTTAYDFLLVTLMVKDDFGEGVPVAWLISNREDICSLDPFFAAIKARIGNFTVDDFMSDDADAFYNAWTRNFPALRRRLLCSWHVDKALRKNIFKCIRNVDEQANV